MASIYYLIGPPGSGKRTIGKELARLTGAALLDNHVANDPIFLAWGADGQNQPPPEVFELVRSVRTAMLKAVELASADRSHIFTNYLADLESDQKVYHGLEELAQRRGASFVPVWLTCPLPELERRMGLPERLDRPKINDPAKLREILSEYGILAPPAGAFVIDTSELSPEEAAQRIIHRG